MTTQMTQQQWGLIYFRKKAQFNQYTQFKNKSFQYQTILGKLHYLNQQDLELNKKQSKKYIKSLNSHLQQLKNIISQIYQDLKFFKLLNMASLVQSFQQLINSLHHYNILDKNNRIQYGRNDLNVQKYNLKITCQKCLASINQINHKRIYDQITTTQANLDNQQTKMTKQQRRKMISQLDQYDILIAQKQNYIRKVNMVLQNKGKVGSLSNHDKTYNFLSQYLSTIEKIQQKRAKSYVKNKPYSQYDDKKWEEESYKHILEYIKRVLFQHFVNQCSGPVKKLFEQINLDKIFKSYGDHAAGIENQQSLTINTIMQNKQTQTSTIPQVQQLKIIQRRMQFKVKQNTTLKTSKDELEKKYMSCLDLNRKIQSDFFQVKKQKKWLQCEMKVVQQNFKVLNEQYNVKVQNYEQQKKQTFEHHINERQKIMRVSKQLEAQFKTLQTQHKKCQQKLNKNKLPIQLIQKQIQTSDDIQIEGNSHHHPSSADLFSKTDIFPNKRRKSIVNKMLFTSHRDGRNGAFFKDLQKGSFMFDSFKKQQLNVDQKSMQESIISTKSLYIQSGVVQFSFPNDQSILVKNHQLKKVINNQQNKYNYKFSKTFKSKFHNKTQQQFQLTNDDLQNNGLPSISKGKRIKMSMTQFKKLRTQQSMSRLQDKQGIGKGITNYKFSNFNRYTQLDQNSRNNVNLTLPQQMNQLSNVENGQFNKQRKIYQVSDRLYKRKQKQNNQLPFQRVIQKGKQKFYIKKISRQSMNYKSQKQRIKQISQILKPYVYNNNNMATRKRRQSRTNLKSIRQRISQLSHSTKRYSVSGGRQSQVIDRRQSIQDIKAPNRRQSISQNNKQRRSSQTFDNNIAKKSIGKDIVQVQNIIQTEFAYLKAVGFIDFINKIGKQNKKLVKAMNKIQTQVKNKFKAPSQYDLQLFGGLTQAQDYVKGKNFWTIDSLKQNMMIYNKNDGLSTKIQKYFNLLKRANPQLYGVLIRFLTDPIFAVYGKKSKSTKQITVGQDNLGIKDLFNQLQKYHKIKHSQCTHIVDFLQKIGFYRYTYF